MHGSSVAFHGWLFHKMPQMVIMIVYLTPFYEMAFPNRDGLHIFAHRKGAENAEPDGPVAFR